MRTCPHCGIDWAGFNAGSNRHFSGCPRDGQSFLEKPPLGKPPAWLAVQAGPPEVPFLTLGALRTAAEQDAAMAAGLTSMQAEYDRLQNKVVANFEAFGMRIVGLHGLRPDEAYIVPSVQWSDAPKPRDADGPPRHVPRTEAEFAAQPARAFDRHHIDPASCFRCGGPTFRKDLLCNGCAR